jgi:glycosyltransferase involved in cell wall biosynthesis
VPIKNVRLLVDAMAIVRVRVPDVQLLIVGDGPERAAVRARVVELDLADVVTLVGSVPHRDTPAFYRAGDVFALSSDFDNSPNAVLEAMACGLPVVATDAGGVRELVDDTVGRVVAIGDAAALADSVDMLCTDDALRSELSANARLRGGEQRFVPSYAHAALERVYAEELFGRPAERAQS